MPYRVRIRSPVGDNPQRVTATRAQRRMHHQAPHVHPQQRTERDASECIAFTAALRLLDAGCPAAVVYSVANTTKARACARAPWTWHISGHFDPSRFGFSGCYVGKRPKGVSGERVFFILSDYVNSGAARRASVERLGTGSNQDGALLTLVGADVPGPHGIAALATDRAALSILRSNATTLQNLSFSNGAPGVSAQYSTVSMTDCEASHNTFSGIIISDSSHLTGLRLRLDSNGTRGLQAWYGSRADCQECDLTGNQNWAAAAFHGSLVTMLDSVVSGNNGLRADNHSYIDIDCASFATSHACSLNATRVGGMAYDHSTMGFYGAGDFTGQFEAVSGSQVGLAGARQLSTGVVSSTNSTPRTNQVNDGSSLRVEPLDDGTGVLQSRLMGTTAVNEFSRTLIYGAGTELTGALNCGSAGDAWVEPGVDLSAFAINGCTHAP